jgi:uncharacterized repeat protein (TIGR01451 family)
MSGKSVMASAAHMPQEVLDQPSAVSAIQAQDTVSTAYVVVRFADNDVVARAVTFTHPISAYKALQLAGLNPVGADTIYGLMLCGIDGVGKAKPDGTDCDNGTRYWGTGYWSDGAWAPRMVGAAQAMIAESGHVESFSWSDPFWTPIDPPPAPPLTSGSKGLDWLRGQQQDDGGFGTPGGTAEVLIAIGANRIDATTWRHSPSVLANMLANGVSLASSGYDPAAGAGKLAVALAANGGCWPVGAAKPMDHYNSVSGTFGINIGSHTWAMIGTAALSQNVPASATAHLELVQLPSGGWEWSAGWGADTNSTALAIQALVAAGEPVTSTAVVSALNYLGGAQNDDGGFPYDPASPWGTDSDTNSTAYVVQALLAVGQDPLTGTWTVTSSNPISFLVSMQLPDGSFEWQKGFGGSQFATQQAIPALLFRPFPVKVAATDPCYGIAGRVTVARAAGGDVSSSSNGDPLADVTVWAQGADDLYFGTTDSTGHYTASVPSAGSYELTPSKGNYVFSPTSRTVEVTGEPGGITIVDEEFASGDADLSIVKTSNVDAVSSGDYLTYTITVSNAGPFPATNVVVTDLLPSEVTSPSLGTVILPDPPGTIVMPHKVWWSLGTLEAGESKTVSLTVKVQPGATGEFTNTAMTTSDVADDMPDNNEDSAVTEVKHTIYLPLIMRNPS